MINYDSNKLSFIFRLDGSIMPKACACALPSVTLTVLLHYGLHTDPFRDHFKFLEENNESALWSAFVIVLGTLLGVRTNKAYSRFWEGITLVQQMRAEWFEAASNLMAFSMVACKKDDHMNEKVNDFQFVLVRLMSLMHGAALRQIGGNEEDFDVLDIQSIDDVSLDYLADCEDRDVNRVEVILHWIQVLVTDSAFDGVIAVAPPILTRAYQTLSRGMVNLHNARKLADVPFPFPLSQMTVALLIIHSLITPLIVASMAKNVFICVCVSFVPIFGMWGMTFVAGELEQPFGSDPNDLPLSVLQYDFNTTLLMLLDKEVSRAPHLVPQTARTLDDLKGRLGSKEMDPLSRTNSFKRRTSEEKALRLSAIHSPSRSPAKGSHRDSLERRKKQHTRVSLSQREHERRNYDSPLYGSECTSEISPRKNSVNTEQSMDTGSLPFSDGSTFSREVSPPAPHNPNLPSIPENGSPVPKSNTSTCLEFKDAGWMPSEERFEMLLDASTEVSRALAALLQEIFSKHGAHKYSKGSLETAAILRPDGQGLRPKRRALGTNPRTPRLPSPMPTPREDEFTGSRCET